MLQVSEQISHRRLRPLWSTARAYLEIDIIPVDVPVPVTEAAQIDDSAIGYNQVFQSRGEYEVC